MNYNEKSQWNERTVQQLVRYEALFKLLDDIQPLEDIETISSQVARKWKYFANISCWRLCLPQVSSYVVIDGIRGEAIVNKVEVLHPWDSFHFSHQIPQLISMADQLCEPMPPEHLRGDAINQIQVFTFNRGEQCIGVLSAAVRNQPFEELDLKYIRLFGSHFTDRISNILLRQHAMDTLKTRASHDALTGIFNRGAIIEYLEKKLVSARQSTEPLSIIFADIDYFKAVNDTYGHLVGDEVLYQVARRLQNNMLQSDHLGRYGGEEFLLVLFPCTQTEIEPAAERLRQAIENTPIIPASDPLKKIKVTISIGAATTESSSHYKIEDLFKRADEALYRAKDSGRNRVEVG